MHDASLTLKMFSLPAIVAYLSLALSASAYVPFGGNVMRWIQHEVYNGIRVFDWGFAADGTAVVSEERAGARAEMKI
jgi:hypothetical protein